MRFVLLMLLVRCTSTPTGPSDAATDVKSDAPPGPCNSAPQNVALVTDPGATLLVQDASSLYVIGVAGRKITRVAKSGWTTTLLVSNAASSGQIQGFAIDTQNLYWTVVGGTGSSSVVSAPIAGGSPNVLVSGRPISVNGNLAVASGVLYWPETNADNVTGYVASMSITGGSVQQIESGATDRIPIFLAVGGAYLYWNTMGDTTDAGAQTSNGATLERAPLGSTTPELVVMPIDSLNPTLATNSASIVYSAGGSEIVRSLSAATSTTLALAPPSALAIDDTNAFAIITQSSIVRAPLDGSGASTPLAPPGSQKYDQVAVDGTCVYWTEHLTGVYAIHK